MTALMEVTPDPTNGLPEEIFLLISRLTPMVNVDLLVKDQQCRTLLSWRNDVHTGQGWHVPGGIVRFKETLEQRLTQVARLEIGAEVKWEPTPITIQQLIHTKREHRGHFISFLYLGSVYEGFLPVNKGLTSKEAGYLAWHERCPTDLLPVHEIYRPFIDGSCVDSIKPVSVYFSL